MPGMTTLNYSYTDHDLLLTDSDQPYVLRFRDMPDQDKPREKLLSQGAASLTVAELVAIVLEVGSTKEDVMAMSQRVLKEYGEKALANVSDPRKFAEALDIPLTKACRIIASLELGRRFHAKRDGRSVHVRNAKQAYAYLRDMGNLKKEQFRGLYLNSRYQIIRDEVISVGSLTANIVHPREVFQPALEHGAVAVIIAHNHPSGNLKPSLADVEITDQLVAAGELLGIDLLDHLIITARSYTSLKKE